ncbi:hypothetical protein HK098_002162 [Nowakowskiella sp. JEL0407]|nr:hypothetical protein HK098_002162 [Nowakowskiella sp. JEL0407]
MKLSLLVASLLFQSLASLVSGHAVLVSPPPRDGDEKEPGLKIANFPVREDQLQQCVGVGKDVGPVKATFNEGGDVLVKWKITIPHKSDPGVRVAIQYPGEQFSLLTENVDVNLNQVSVKLPAGKSGQAILQWLWASQADGGFYMACSDINVKAKSESPASPSPAAPSAAALSPAASPAPEPSPIETTSPIVTEVFAPLPKAEPDVSVVPNAASPTSDLAILPTDVFAVLPTDESSPSSVDVPGESPTLVSGGEQSPVDIIQPSPTDSGNIVQNPEKEIVDPDETTPCDEEETTPDLSGAEVPETTPDLSGAEVPETTPELGEETTPELNENGLDNPEYSSDYVKRAVAKRGLVRRNEKKLKCRSKGLSRRSWWSKRDC